MQYTLMHKNIKVLDLDISIEGYITKVLDIYSLDHLPTSVICKKGIIDKNTLKNWWNERCIPNSRYNLSNLLQTLNISSPQALLIQSFGLSLSDQYWIKPYNEDILWNNINFFENDFSNDIGDILFGNINNTKNINKNSPDNTCIGDLPKRWEIIDGKRILLKAGTNIYRQQVFNEIIAYRIANLLNINAIEYKLYWTGKEPYCGCENFVSKDEDLVPVWDLMQTVKQSNSTSNYQHIVNVAKENGINDIVDNLNKMLVLDYIIANEDRHLNNFGFIKDVNTNKFKCFSPIFDTGSSFGYDIINEELDYYKPNWKPFMHGKAKIQLDLVTDYSWINVDKLDLIPNIINQVANESNGYINNERIDKLIKFINKRIAILKDKISNFII